MERLPVGAYVRVTEHGPDPQPPYYAIVRGYDDGGTKYKLGRRYGGWGGWQFTDGGSWAFIAEVREVTEAQATETALEEGLC